jgi:hypothetical protein
MQGRVLRRLLVGNNFALATYLSGDFVARDAYVARALGRYLVHRNSTKQLKKGVLILDEMIVLTNSQKNVFQSNVTVRQQLLDCQPL